MPGPAKGPGIIVVTVVGRLLLVRLLVALCRCVRCVGGRGRLLGGGSANPGDGLGDRLPRASHRLGDGIACSGHRLGGGLSGTRHLLRYGLACLGHGLGDGAARTGDSLACTGNRVGCGSLGTHDLLADLLTHDLAQLRARQLRHDDDLPGERVVG